MGRPASNHLHQQILRGRKLSGSTWKKEEEDIPAESAKRKKLSRLSIGRKRRGKRGE